MASPEDRPADLKTGSSRRALLTGAALGGGIGAVGLLVGPGNAKAASGALQAVFNVREFGAKGDALHDDTGAIQAAIDAAAALRHGVVYFPPQDPQRGYRVKRTLTIRAPISIVGAGPNAVTLMAIGFEAGQILLDFDCKAEDVVQHVSLSGFTLRSNNARATGLRLKNASHVLLKQLVTYGVADGVVITGKGSYSINFEQFTGYDIGRYSVWFQTASGGFYSFLGSTFAGKTGVFVDAASGLNGVGFVNCNFEQCVASSLHVQGDLLGLAFSGCRTEGCDHDDFLITPSAGKLVAGLSITGCHFSSDSGASRPIVLGGGGGRVRGFNICGNFVGHGGNTFVHAHHEAGSGVIAANYFSRETMQACNSKSPSIHLNANENSRGKGAEGE